MTFEALFPYDCSTQRTERVVSRVKNIIKAWILCCLLPLSPELTQRLISKDCTSREFLDFWHQRCPAAALRLLPARLTVATVLVRAQPQEAGLPSDQSSPKILVTVLTEALKLFLTAGCLPSRFLSCTSFQYPFEEATVLGPTLTQNC